MSNDLIENRHPRLALPIGRIRVPKFLYITLAILGILVLVVGGLNIYITKLKITNLPPVKLTNLEIIKTTLSWLDKQRDERGVYTAGLKCDFKSKCEVPISSDTSGFSVLWAEYRYLLNNNDKKELELFEKNLNLYSDRSVNKEIKNNFWNCYLMWDMGKSYNLSQIVKDKLEKICFDSTYELSDTKVNVITDNKKTKEIIDSLVLDLIDNKAIIDGQLVSNSIINEYFVEDVQENQYFFNSSDRLARYLWKKDEKDLLGGLIDFQQSLEAYKNRQAIEIKAYEGCQTGIASLMLSYIFNDYKYYTLSTIILDQQIQKINKNSIRDVSVCGFFADKLYKETKREIFKEKKLSIINDFLVNNFDKKDGSFYSKTKTSLVKEVMYNGLMIGILVD